MKYHLAAVPGRNETWCHRISDNTVIRYTADTLLNACKSCHKNACEDCGGTGFIGGSTVGIGCHCEFNPENKLVLSIEE